MDFVIIKIAGFIQEGLLYISKLLVSNISILLMLAVYLLLEKNSSKTA